MEMSLQPLIPANAGTQMARRRIVDPSSKWAEDHIAAVESYDLDPGIRRDERVWLAASARSSQP